MSLEYGVEYEYRKTPIGIYHTTTTNERRLGYLLSKHQTLDTHLRPYELKKWKTPLDEALLWQREEPAGHGVLILEFWTVRISGLKSQYEHRGFHQIPQGG